MRSIPIERYHGNRFNILFSNAASVYFMKEKVKEYLMGDASTRLLKAVKYDINVPDYLAGLKALGLISYLITAPLYFRVCYSCPRYHRRKATSIFL